jgi:hypothetical protein
MTCIRSMNSDELSELMEVFKLNTKSSHILNPSIIIYNNGNVYKGEVDVLNGNLKHGYGEMLYKNGDVFATKWKNDLAQGAGIYISNDGLYIQGNWKNGLLNCNTKSIVKYPDGDYYNGQLYNNSINGYGIFTYVDGEVYDGEFINGVRSGYGTIYFRNGYIYKGYWENDTFNGYGVLYTIDKIYTGLWNNGEQDVSGEIIILSTNN